MLGVPSSGQSATRASARVYYITEQPCSREHIVTLSWLHGVGVPPHVVEPVCHWQPECPLVHDV